MNSRRQGCPGYLAVLGLPEGSPPLTVLGRSGGCRAGDSVFLVDVPAVERDGRACAVFFIHGARHKPGAEATIAGLHVGDILQLRDDSQNPVNPPALLVAHDGTELGWVPDLLLDFAHQVRAEGWFGDTGATGQRLGHPAPPPSDGRI